MKIELTLDDPNRLIAEVQRLFAERGGRLQEIPEIAIRKGVFMLQALVQKHVPKATSTYARNVVGTVRRIANDLVEGKVGTFVLYAEFLERGTGRFGPFGRPFEIRAKRAKALFWGQRVGGSVRDPKAQLLFRRKVTIQGMKPRAPFQKAIKEFLPRFVALIEAELAKGVTA